jgi:hypothetical protein
MSKSLIDAALYDNDKETITDELPDVALEVAASQMYTGHPYTLAFCTGFSSCPFGAPDRGQRGEAACKP